MNPGISSENNILAFDSIFSLNSMQLLKIVLPLIPGEYQPALALFIKFQELQYTYQYLMKHPIRILQANPDLSMEEKITLSLKEIRPYCPEKYITYLDQLDSVLLALQKYKEVEPILSMVNGKEGIDPLRMFISKEQNESIHKYEDLMKNLIPD